MSQPLLKIVFVCMGNICRSPTAEAVFRQKLVDHDLDQYVLVDSAGTHNYHPGSPPDERSQAHAARRGYDLSPLRARAVHDGDFTHFDLLLTMDWDNRALLEERCPPSLQHKIRGFAEFLQKTAATAIPDPYYEGAAGFEQVLDLVEEAADGLLQLVRHEVGRLPPPPGRG